MSAGPGWGVPVPGFSTLEARPEAVVWASAGGAATSAGAGIAAFSATGGAAAGVGGVTVAGAVGGVAGGSAALAWGARTGKVTSRAAEKTVIHFMTRYPT